MENKNNLEEIWRDIEEYNGYYQISNFGRVKSLSKIIIRNNGKTLPVKEKIRKPTKDGWGYLQVNLSKNGKKKNHRIHRLVASTFIPNPNGYEQVNHKDENPSNNRVDNLEWCDAKYNNNYGTRTERAGKAIAKSNTNNPKLIASLTNHPMKSKQVAQIDKNTGEIIKIWQSTAECGRNGFNRGNITSCCRNERKYHKGYIWKYI